MKKIITPIIMAIYLVVGIIAAVGAINYGIASAEHIYTVAGAMNLAFVAFGLRDAWKKWSNNE